MYFTLLPQRALFAVSGADAETFLQGLISNDLRKLAPDQMMYAAMLSPQGKFLHDFFLTRRGDAILMDCDGARANDLVARLNLYKLRAQVTIEKLSDSVTAAWEEKSPPLAGGNKGGNSIPSSPPYPPINGGANIFLDPRLEEMGYRIIGAVDNKTWQQVDFMAYEKHRLALGVPDGAQDMIIDRSFLLELGFEELRGVDFNKGCYVGQEVTARSKFRGQVRKHIYQVQAGQELPPLGTPVMQDGAAVGELRSHAGNIGLAMLRIEAVEKNAPLTADNVTIRAALPKWVRPLAA